MIYGRTIREKRKRIDHWKEQTYESEKRLCTEMDSEVFYHSADHSVNIEYVGLQWNNDAV